MSANTSLKKRKNEYGGACRQVVYRDGKFQICRQKAEHLEGHGREYQCEDCHHAACKKRKQKREQQKQRRLEKFQRDVSVGLSQIKQATPPTGHAASTPTIMPPRGNPPKTLGNGGIMGSRKNEKGEVIQWDETSRDGRELKVYVENYCVTKNLSTWQIKAKYPQFQKYASTTLGDAVSRARAAFDKSIHDRATLSAARCRGHPPVPVMPIPLTARTATSDTRQDRGTNPSEDTGIDAAGAALAMAAECVELLRTEVVPAPQAAAAASQTNESFSDRLDFFVKKLKAGTGP